METLASRIQEARVEAGFDSPAALAKAVGVKPAAVYQWETGETQSLKGETLIDLADALKVNPKWLLRGKLPKRAMDAMSAYLFVRFHRDKRVSGGPGAVNDESRDATTGLAFLEASLRRKGLSDESAAAIVVVGESMMPRLRDGDTVVYDEADTNLRDGKMYVIRWGDELIVKRLFRELDASIRIVSENKSGEFPDRFVRDGDDGFEIKGRVRWIGSWED